MPARPSSAATASARSSRSTWPSATARSCGPPSSPTRRCSCSCPRRPSASAPSTPSSRRRCARAGPQAGVEAWLGGRADGPALARARAAHRAFFADYAGLASWPVTRRELRALDMPAVVLTGPWSPPHIVAAADALAGAAARRAARRRRRPRGRRAQPARVTLSAAPRCRLREGLPPARCPARRAARAARRPRSAAPAPNAPCAAIVAPGPADRAAGAGRAGTDRPRPRPLRRRDRAQPAVRRLLDPLRQPGRPRARRVGDVDARWPGAAPRRGRARSAAGAVDGCTRPAGTSSACASRRSGGGAPVEAELQVTATDCQLASLVQRPGARRRPGRGGGLGRPRAALDRVAAGQRALRDAARRAPGHGRSARRTQPSAARLGAEPQRPQPAHHRAAARHERGARAVGGRRRRAAGTAARCRRG